jgi:hypothetical protein
MELSLTNPLSSNPESLKSFADTSRFAPKNSRIGRETRQSGKPTAATHDPDCAPTKIFREGEEGDYLDLLNSGTGFGELRRMPERFKKKIVPMNSRDRVKNGQMEKD